jgi:GNAT superfamily N-acetyltransferase
MSNQIHIREFDPRYQAAAADLINKSLGARFGFMDVTKNPDLYDIETTYGAGDFLLAFEGDLLVATGALMPKGDSTGQIARMHTAAPYRRQGIGTRVLETLEIGAQTRGFSALILETNNDWDDAIAFYVANGYGETGRSDVEVTFQKALPIPA